MTVPPLDEMQMIGYVDRYTGRHDVFNGIGNHFYGWHPQNDLRTNIVHRVVTWTSWRYANGLTENTGHAIACRATMETEVVG